MNVLPSVEQLRARAWAIPAAVALGCAALAARSVSVLSLGPTVAVGVLGLGGVVSYRDAEHPSRARTATVTLIGIGAVAAVRLISPPIHVAYTSWAFGANVVAAVAEEAFFRRFVYGWIAARSEDAAIIIAAILFAVIHIPIYGVGVLPIDFAAGLLLGWQRRESGTWLSPAATHVVANIILMR
ncbi:MAG TPA: CPBP family intramembrane glutamic endopeptidase [Actinomycetota bacterium]|nr:CPBP family intramembrane glutamic endopeptidase [Actinomycetota bacterium]